MEILSWSNVVKIHNWATGVNLQSQGQNRKLRGCVAFNACSCQVGSKTLQIQVGILWNSLESSLSPSHWPSLKQCLECSERTSTSGVAASGPAPRGTAACLWCRSRRCEWSLCKCWSTCPPGCSRGRSRLCWSPRWPDTAGGGSGRSLHPPHLGVGNGTTTLKWEDICRVQIHFVYSLRTDFVK